jgi:hypothetical protein
MGNSENKMKPLAFKAKIFVPFKGIDWRINSSKLMYGGYFLFLTIGLIASQVNLSSNIDFSIRTLLFSILGLIFYSAYWGSREKEKKYGKLEGELEICVERIRINDYSYSWTEIEKFEFRIFQVVDEILWTETYPIARYYGGPAYSQGVNNFIEFMVDDKKVKVFFQLETPSHKVELRRMIRLLFFHDRIDLSTTYLGLNLEYEETQELKKAKGKYLEDQQSKVSS